MSKSIQVPKILFQRFLPSHWLVKWWGPSQIAQFTFYCCEQERKGDIEACQMQEAVTRFGRRKCRSQNYGAFPPKWDLQTVPYKYLHHYYPLPSRWMLCVDFDKFQMLDLAIVIFIPEGWWVQPSGSKFGFPTITVWRRPVITLSLFKRNSNRDFLLLHATG